LLLNIKELFIEPVILYVPIVDAGFKIAEVAFPEINATPASPTAEVTGFGIYENHPAYRYARSSENRRIGS
jgi:hypothetical protein